MNTAVDSKGAPIFHMVQSWGVASARHTSGCVVFPSALHDGLDGGDKEERDCAPSSSSSSSSLSQESGDDSQKTEYLFDVPIGPSIVRWDFRTKKRQLQFQAHCDAVTSMRMSDDRKYIATSCFSGEVKLWSPQWECLDHVTAPMTSQHHLAWSHDSRRFLVVGNGHNSSVVVYDILNSNDQEGEVAPQLKEAWRVRAGQPFNSMEKASGEKDKDNVKDENTEKASASAVNSKDSGLEYQYGDAFYMAEINPSGNVFAVEERPKKTTLARLYSPSGELLKTSELSVPTHDPSAAGTKGPGVAAASSGSREGSAVQTLLISTYKDGSYAIVVQGGYVIFVDAEGLTITNSFKAGYSSRTCVWDGEALVLPSDSGKVVWWSRTGKKLASFSVGSSDYVVRLDWSVSGRALWMCGFSTMTCLEVKKSDDGAIKEVNQLYAIHSHSIACCGAGFSPDGRSLASGDLAGNIWVTEEKNYSPEHTSTVAASVRCIAWRSADVMLIGCLDGRVHQWQVGGVTKELLHLEGSVLHMQFDHQLELFAVGTSKGVLTIYDATSKDGDHLKLITAFLAHPPQQGPQNPRFGQLGIQAEIWSLCWSPHDNMVATSSEDQTTKIWKTKGWTCLTTLRGHTTAVTSVDWKLIGQQSIIATCADDRTVRLSSGESFELIRIVDTKDIFGWHTLTYLSFHHSPGSSLLVCTTQNGHLVVWNSLTGERLARGKIHLGSIEGLAWQREGDSLATVGADCVVNLLKLNLPQTHPRKQ